jgi:integrase
MALRMARPWKDPKTGTYYLRQRPPRDLAARIKGTRVTLHISSRPVLVTVGAVVQASLRTKSIAEAKVRHSEADAELKRYWDALRVGQRPLTHREAVALAGEFYHAATQCIDNDRSRYLPRVIAEAKRLGSELMAQNADFETQSSQLIAELEASGIAATWAGFEDPSAVPVEALEAAFGAQADVLLQRKAVVTDADSRRLLMRELSRATRLAADRGMRNAANDYSADLTTARFPAWPDAASTPAKSPTITAWQIFEAWEAGPKQEVQPATVKRYRCVFGFLAAFFKDRDVNTLTDDDIHQWATYRRDHEGVSARSINRNDLAAVRALFGWATTRDGSRRMRRNPVVGLRLPEEKTRRKRPKFFLEHEATRILQAALAVEADLKFPHLSAAKRWCPWLAAYSGARISEVANLEAEDIWHEAGFPIMYLRKTKEGEPRMVPLHDHLIESGFLDFVAQRRTGPLFYDASRKRRGIKSTPAQMVGKSVALWVREVSGIADGVSPNHGWRHTWKTRAIHPLFDPSLRDGITGHAPASEGRRYEAPPIGKTGPAMKTFPRYEVSAGGR